MIRSIKARPYKIRAALLTLGSALVPVLASAQSTSTNLLQIEATSSAAGGTNATIVPTTQLLATQAEQAALIEKLLRRLEQLEQKESSSVERGQAIEKAHQAEVQRLLGRIGELEGKVGSLESGRVLPEIVISAKDGPTSQELDQKIRVLDRKNELAAEAAEAKAKEQPKLSIGQNGFAFSSADTNFVLKLRGLLQADSRTFFQDNVRNEGNDSFLLRRARPIIEGTVFRDFDFLFTPDFGGPTVQIVDAYLNYRNRPELQVRFGKFKGPVGLEQLQADAVSSFNERSLATALVPTRNVGVQLWGELFGGVASYAAGVFNNAGDGRTPNNNDFNDDKEFAGRVLFQPFKRNDWESLRGFGFGLGGSYSQINTNANGLAAGYNTDGQQAFFTYNPLVGSVVANGSHWRLSPQAYYYYGPFGLLGEYVISHQGVRNLASGLEADLEHHAWQVSAQWVLTGEAASFSGLTPKNPFDLRTGTWGAFQLVGRFAQLDIDRESFPVFADATTSAREAFSWSVGLNWWLNKNLRVLTSFSHTTFEGGGTLVPSVVPPATVTHQAENALFTRVQLAF